MRKILLTLPTRILQLLLFSSLILSPAWASPKFQILHAFAGGTDGSYPYTPLLDRSGNLFGVTIEGGSLTNCSPYGCGVAFELSQKNGGWKENVLYSFSTSASPFGPLATDSHGNLYGIQQSGNGSCSCGAIYQLARSGGVWTENVLHTFTGTNGDGAYAYSGLVQDAVGNLYGTTQQGGTSNNSGTLFELTPNTDGTWAYSVIYNFGSTNYLDGNTPYGPLTVDSSGNLYGTTLYGGEYGNGTVFRLSSSGGKWAETILYNFTLDYGVPPYPFGVVIDAAGNLYGATLDGGAYAVGTIYKLTPSVGFWNRTVLHTFSGGADGAYPYGLAIGSSGVLYGTTNYGGTYGYGNVFKLEATNGKWNESAMHMFTNGSDGAHPNNGVVVDQQGNLYGAAESGGAYGFGVVFKITP